MLRKEFHDVRRRALVGHLAKTGVHRIDPTGNIEVKGGDAGKAAAFLAALGGKDNIESVTNCATRLRVSVKDETLVQPVGVFKKAGAHGLVAKGKAFQVIVGLTVPYVREEFEKLL